MKSILKINIVLLSLGILTSCGGGEETKKEEPKVQDTTSKDSVVVYETPEELVGFIDKFEDITEFPIKIDKTYCDSSEQGDTLIGEEVKILLKNFKSTETTDFIDYYIDAFYNIDSLKSVDGYTAWAAERDLGNIKYADCYFRHKAQLNPETQLIFWSLVYSTYEACPYGYGTYIFATIVYKGEITESFSVAEHTGGGDPPVSGSDERYCEISQEGNIKIAYQGISDEDNEQPKVELTLGNFEYEIKEGKFVVISEKKDKPKMVKRETVED